MTTGQNVHDALPLDAGVITTANTVKAINAAIAAAWPAIKVTKYSEGEGTFASGTFDYSLTATGITEQFGIQRVYINPATSTDEPEFLTRQYRVYLSDSTWHIVFDADVVDGYTSQTFDVEYIAKPSSISLIGDTLDTELPWDFLIHYCIYWYAQRQMSKQNIDTRAWEGLLVEAEKQWRAARRANMILPPTQPYRVRKDRMN